MHYPRPGGRTPFWNTFRYMAPFLIVTSAPLTRMLQGDYILPSDTTIAPKTRAATTLRAATTVNAGSTSAKGPRKWHEKFKATRRTEGKSSDQSKN